MRVALAHHWLVGMRGGEKVLEQLCLLFPGAPIYTLVADSSRLSATILRHPIHTSFLQKLPGGRRHYKSLLPLFPTAVQSLVVPEEVDLVISSDASIIKGLRHGKNTRQVCYCHSPPRYLWDLQTTYLQQTSGLGMLGKLAFKTTTPYVREFDRVASANVDTFIANSQFVQARIQSSYGRDSTVINPPVNVSDFQLDQPGENFFLIVSELTPYKRVDLAVQAFNQLGEKLVIIGQGSELENLKKMAGPTIQFLGSQPFSVLKAHYESCRAFVFPGLEDFGITPLEAQAAGKPVIGFGAGGLLETTRDGVTGVFFHEQTADALIAAVRRFHSLEKEFQPSACRDNALRFTPEIFRKALQRHFEVALPELFSNYSWPVF